MAAGKVHYLVKGTGLAYAAVNKAAGKGSSVTQEIAMSVNGDNITCSINGTVDPADLVWRPDGGSS